MNVSLTAELEAYVQAKVASGLYGSASEVVREALRLLKERDRVYGPRLQTLREEVERGVRQVRAGKARSLDRQAVSDIKAEARRRAAAQRQKRA